MSHYDFLLGVLTGMGSALTLILFGFGLGVYWRPRSLQSIFPPVESQAGEPQDNPFEWKHLPVVEQEQGL